MSAATEAAETSAFSVAPLPPHTAAEICGIDLSSPVDGQAREQLNRLFAEYPVLAFRDQTLTAQQLVRAVQLFGEVFPQHNPRFQVPECPEVHYISNQDRFPDGRVYIPGEGFHTDHSNDARPPKATILYALKLPSTGGDTQFINMYRAYEAPDRGAQGDPCLSEQPQRAAADEPDGGAARARSQCRAANGDYDMSEVRYLYRIMLKGEVPAQA